MVRFKHLIQHWICVGEPLLDTSTARLGDLSVVLRLSQSHGKSKMVSLCSTGRNLDESRRSQANFPFFNVGCSSLIAIYELMMAKMEKAQPKLDLLGMTLIKSG